jgi:hypothetical protein
LTHARLGLNCPVEAYEQVKVQATVSAPSRREAVFIKDLKDSKAAQNAILRLFPQIPLAHCQAVLDHAYAKGTGRVGRIGTLDDEEKVTLAIVAHIRHTMTPYDQLLRSLEYQSMNDAARKDTARVMVRGRINEVLNQWRAPDTIARPPKSRQRPKRSPRKKSPLQKGSELQPGYVPARKVKIRHKRGRIMQRTPLRNTAQAIHSLSSSGAQPPLPHRAAAMTSNSRSVMASMYASTSAQDIYTDPKSACTPEREVMYIFENFIKPPHSRNPLKDSMYAANANFGPSSKLNGDSSIAECFPKPYTRVIIDLSTNIVKPPLTRNPLMDSIYAIGSKTNIEDPRIKRFPEDFAVDADAMDLDL